MLRYALSTGLGAFGHPGDVQMCVSALRFGLPTEFAQGLLNEVVVVPCRYMHWIFLLISNLLWVYQRVKNFYYTNNYLVIHVMSGAKGAVAVLNAQTAIALPCFENWVAVGLSGWVCSCWGRILGAHSQPCFEVVEWSSTLASPISI